MAEGNTKEAIMNALLDETDDTDSDHGDDDDPHDDVLNDSIEAGAYRCIC